MGGAVVWGAIAKSRGEQRRQAIFRVFTDAKNKNKKLFYIGLIVQILV
jgi:hypothetical protein